MKKIFLIISFVCGLLSFGIIFCAFSAPKYVVESSYTPFPTTGTIIVNKFKMFKKEKIGELRWSATLEDCSGSSFVRVNLRITNTTDEYVPFSFGFSESNESIRDEVRPNGDFNKEYVIPSPLGRIVPSQKEINLQ